MAARLLHSRDVFRPPLGGSEFIFAGARSEAPSKTNLHFSPSYKSGQAAPAHTTRPLSISSTERAARLGGAKFRQAHPHPLFESVESLEISLKRPKIARWPQG